MRPTATLIVLLFMLFFTQLSAQKLTALTIKMLDGSKTSFVLSESPTATIHDDTLRLVSTSLNANFARADIEQCFFEKIDSVATQLENISDNELRYTYVDNLQIIIEGAKAGSHIRLYNTKGICISSQIVKEPASITTINLRELPIGAYIMSITHQPSIKIIKK